MDETELRKACFEGDVRAVRAGLAAGCDPSAGNAKGMTPLMLAVWQRDAADVVRTLLDAGADPGARQPSSDWSAATFAAVNGRVASLAILLERGALLEGDWKALHFAVQYRSRDTVLTILDAGVDVDAQDADGRTALMRAARSSDGALVALLLERGASPHATDAEGWTPLHFAATKANVASVVALCAAGADTQANAGDGRAKIVAALA